MPVVGLPTTVEDVLSTLLCNSSVTSWKVAGTEGGSVFVLRLKGNQSQTDSAMTPAPVAWRRKPPSQQLRDQRRAELHYTKVGNKDSDTSNFDSFALQKEDVSMCGIRSNENDSNRRPTEVQVSDKAKVDVAPLRAARADDTHAVPHSTVSLLTPTAVSSEQMFSSEGACGDNRGASEPTGLSGEDINTSDGETESQSTDDAMGAHQLGTVLSALGEEQKHKLLDKTRNIRIRKTMCRAKGGKKTLLAESEDCLLVFDCETFETRLFDVKHEAASDDLRQDMLALQKGQQVSRVRFKEEIEQITKDLHDYVAEIRKCLDSRK